MQAASIGDHCIFVVCSQFYSPFTSKFACLSFTLDCHAVGKRIALFNNSSVSRICTSQRSMLYMYGESIGLFPKPLQPFDAWNAALWRLLIHQVGPHFFGCGLKCICSFKIHNNTINPYLYVSTTFSPLYT